MEDYYEDLCEIDDYYGMEALTEEEQILVILDLEELEIW